MKNGVFVYISGPIAPRNGKPIEENVLAGVYAFIKLTQLGIPSFCPHLGAMFPSCHSEVSYQTWMDYDLAVIDRCTHMLMLPGWRESSGSRQEREYAEGLEMPIFESLDNLAAYLDLVGA